MLPLDPLPLHCLSFPTEFREPRNSYCLFPVYRKSSPSIPSRMPGLPSQMYFSQPCRRSGLVTHRISPCVYFLGGWGSRINPIYHYNLPKPLGNFLYGKVSQSQHYGYFGLDYSSLWRTVLCILNVQLHPWPLTTRCQGAHPPPLWQSKMSPAIARVPWGTKLPRCSLPHKYTKEFLLFH